VPDAATGSAPEPFVARFSVPKLLAWAIPSAGMAALCFPFAVGGLASGKVAGIVLGLAGAMGLLFFGLIAAVQAARLFDRREQVVIDSGGLTVRSHGAGRIALRSIKGMKQDMGRLSLYLHKPAKHPIETRHRRFIYRINGSAAREFFGDVWIWSNQLDQPLAAFVDAIAAHRPQTDFEKQLAETIAINRSNAAG